MDEFEFIASYLAPLAGPEGLGLKDDAALFKPSIGKDLIITKDTMVEGLHFPHSHYGKRTAEKLLRVNLSDLAAKGAKPLGYLLSIVWPHNVDQNVFKDFASGLAVIQKAYGFKLLGGDTTSTRGPMVVTATLIGEVPEGKMVKRSQAQIGDDIWVSGTIGDAYLGVRQVLGKPIDPKPKSANVKKFEDAYFRPEPRLSLREILREYAHSCVDVSDGLIADAGHISNASQKKLVIDLFNIPLSKATQDWAGQDIERLKTLVAAGDDYELVFTSSPENAAEILEASDKISVPLTKIGMVSAGKAVDVLDSKGKIIKFDQTGHKHF